MLQFARAQYTYLPIALSPEQCRGRTYIITGSNIGLGYECVKHLTELGAARVIMAVRNLKAGEAAKSTIEQATGRTDVLEVWHLDLSSFDSVKAFVKRAQNELDRLDGLVANAAIATDKWAEAEGMESTITVNIISTLLMTVLLLPWLQKMAKTQGIHPTISIMGSAAAFHVEDVLPKIDRNDILRDLSNKQDWESEMEKSRYPLSKLLLHFAFYALCDLVPTSKTGVTINLVNPGLCYSGLTRNSSFITSLPILTMRALVGRTTEKGSRTLLHGLSACSDSHGQYLTECRVSNDSVPEWVKNEDGRLWQSQVWKEVSEKLEEIEGGCVQQLKAV